MRAPSVAPTTSSKDSSGGGLDRRLEKSDGLVVQGPPGTGKTHTIANIISHMLATGRRVLVVSHGETALSVIRDQLPVGARDLAISVTTSEREGLKQVEKAINLMLGIVNDVSGNQALKLNLIRGLEANIVKNRKRLAEIDAQLAAIATTHLSHVPVVPRNPTRWPSVLSRNGLSSIGSRTVPIVHSPAQE
jgi:predicted ATP-dependent serine protease